MEEREDVEEDREEDREDDFGGRGGGREEEDEWGKAGRDLTVEDFFMVWPARRRFL